MLLFIVVAKTTAARLVLVVRVITFMLLAKTLSFVDERLLLGRTQQPVDHASHSLATSYLHTAHNTMSHFTAVLVFRRDHRLTSELHLNAHI